MAASTTTSFNEEKLVQAAQRGQLPAFNELILHYQHQVYNLAYHIMQDPAAADDATQEAFISAYHALAKFRGGSFRAWLLRIVRNACYDELRRYKRHPSISWEDFGELDKEANPYLRSKVESPEESVQRDELCALLERTLKRLPIEQQTTLFLVDRLGLAYDEVGATMEVPLGTVKSRLYRARGKMREYLMETQELLPSRYRQKGSQ